MIGPGARLSGYLRPDVAVMPLDWRKLGDPLYPRNTFTPDHHTTLRSLGIARISNAGQQGKFVSFARVTFFIHRPDSTESQLPLLLH